MFNRLERESGFITQGPERNSYSRIMIVTVKLSSYLFTYFTGQACSHDLRQKIAKCPPYAKR